WNSFTNHFNQILSCQNGPALPSSNDRSRDASRATLFSFFVDHARELRLRQAIHEIGRRAGFPGIHAHVKWPLGLAAKTTCGLVQLPGGHSQIKNHAIESRNFHLLEQFWRLAMMRMH